MRRWPVVIKPYLLPLIWLLVSGCLAATMELWEDEAYYFYWSDSPAWGYFHHPPMVAWLIQLGYQLFPYEFGVRFFFVLMSSGSLWALRRLVGEAHGMAVTWVALGSFAFFVYSFLALPDSPLIFFSLLYLLVLKAYDRRDSWQLATCWGLLVTCLLYTKYHALLLIVLSVVSLPHLLGRRSFWWATVFAVISYAPHLRWLWINDLITIRFHSSAGLATNGFESLLSFVGSQLLFIHPLLGVVLIYFLLRPNEPSGFGRSLRWVALGTWVVLAAIAPWKEIRPHWSLVGIVALYAYTMPQWRTLSGVCQRMGKLAIVGGVLITCLLSVFFVIDYLPSTLSRHKYHLQNHLHEWEDFSLALQAQADGRQVVFKNSYVKASMFFFYTGEKAYCHPVDGYLPTQFQLENWEDVAQGREVLYVEHEREEDPAFFTTGNGKYYRLTVYPSFASIFQAGSDHEQ